MSAGLYIVVDAIKAIGAAALTTAADLSAAASAAVAAAVAVAEATAGIEGGVGGGPDGMGGTSGADTGSNKTAGRTGNLPRARIVSVSTSSEAELIKELKSGQGRQTPIMGSN